MPRKKSNGGNGHARAPVEREQRELECVLTQDEMLARGHTMADAELEIDKLKATRKGVNGEIASLSEQRNKLATAIETGVESRMVACVWVEDLAHNCHRCIRQDTGAECDTRVMTADDLQGELGLDDADGDGDGGDDYPDTESSSGDEAVELHDVIDADELISVDEAAGIERDADGKVSRLLLPADVASSRGKPKRKPAAVAKSKPSSKPKTKPLKSKPKHKGNTRHAHA